MKVKFYNTEVDIWKLRQGIVLARVENNYTVFVHLHGFENYYAFGQEMKLYVFEDGQYTEYYPHELTWTEPH